MLLNPTIYAEIAVNFAYLTAILRFMAIDRKQSDTLAYKWLPSLGEGVRVRTERQLDITP